MKVSHKQGKRGPRPATPPARKLRALLAENVRRLIDLHYANDRYPTLSARQRAYAKDCGVSWSSVQRVLDPTSGASIDLVADLAVGVNMRPHDLLNPNLFSGNQENGHQAAEVAAGLRTGI